MISKSEIKFVRSLKLKKYRQKYNLFVAEGDRNVSTMLTHGKLTLHKLFAISEWSNGFRNKVPSNKIIQCHSDDLKKLSALQTPPVVIGLFEIPTQEPLSDKYPNSVIYLDDIQDPGNMGTILRIADWYGINHIVRSEASADFFNPKVIQASMGSLGNVPLSTLSNDLFQLTFKEYYRIGAILDSPTKISIPRDKPICLVIGNEGQGISDSVQNCLTHHLCIAGSKNRVAESLNAGVATGIMCQILFGESLQ